MPPYERGRQETKGCRNDLADSRERLLVLFINALILPGLGHCYVKRFLPGIAIAVSFTSFAIFVIVKFALAVYHYVAAKGWEAGLGGTLTLIASLWENAPFRFSLIAAVLLWAVSIVDSFRITSKR